LISLLFISQCTLAAVELGFTFVPLVASLVHPVASVWLLTPARTAAQRLCPWLATLLPTPEPVAFSLFIFKHKILEKFIPKIKNLIFLIIIFNAKKKIDLNAKLKMIR
jgi:hypothetical protein